MTQVGRDTRRFSTGSTRVSHHNVGGVDSPFSNTRFSLAETRIVSLLTVADGGRTLSELNPTALPARTSFTPELEGVREVVDSLRSK